MPVDKSLPGSASVPAPKVEIPKEEPKEVVTFFLKGGTKITLGVGESETIKDVQSTLAKKLNVKTPNSTIDFANYIEVIEDVMGKGIFQCII